MPATLGSLFTIQPKLSPDASSTSMYTAPPDSKNRLIWDVLSTDRLLLWMEIPGNMDRYRSAAIPSSDGRKRTSAKSKVAISKTIVEFLREKGFDRTDEQIRTKISKFIERWKKAHLVSMSTGFGITEEEAAKGVTVTDKLKKLCKEWDRLNPLLSLRAGMNAPFVADNEDPVDDAIFADVMPSNSASAATFDLVRVTDEMLASVEDHRSLADRKLDNEASESDDEDHISNGPKRSAGSNGSGLKKLRIAVEPRKKSKTMDLVDLFVDDSKEKHERSEKKFQMMERNMDFKMKKHADNIELQKSEMRLREREIKLREDETSIRKMELQLLLRKE